MRGPGGVADVLLAAIRAQGNAESVLQAQADLHAVNIMRFTRVTAGPWDERQREKPDVRGHVVTEATLNDPTSRPCAICLARFVLFDRVVELECQHAFHMLCFANRGYWASCPVDIIFKRCTKPNTVYPGTQVQVV